MQLYLDDSLKSYFKSNEPLFDQLMALQGEVFRAHKKRTTQRIQLGTRYFYIKQHRGVGWGEIFKCLLQGRKPILGAQNEWQAIQALQTVGIAVPRVYGYGKRGLNPATQESFVLLEAIEPSISLETLYQKTPLPSVTCKRDYIREIARITRIMHAYGMNHRDLYICHFLIKSDSPTLMLTLIDLHRASMHRYLPFRWRCKDLAGLYFSSKEAKLTTRDYLRFIKHYHNKPLRESLKTQDALWQAVVKRGEALYRDHQVT